MNVGSKPLPYGRQTISDADIEAVVEVLRSDWLTTGPNVVAFEQAFASFVDARHAIAVSNGTAALHVAMLVAGVGPEDEVIVPAMTFAASANAARYVGANVVFADCLEDTLTVDVDDVASKVTARTRAVVAVDYGGQPADLDELLKLTRAHGLVLIEDAAHAVGATYRERAVGSIADLTTFSFHPVKQMTTGEGGMITTNCVDFDEKARVFRNHGITTDHRQREQQGSFFYEMKELGFNYRITDFQCALGSMQLRRLSGWIDRRREIASRYAEAFAAIRGILPLSTLEDRESAWHLYVIKLDLELLSADRAQIFTELRSAGLGVNVHYIPVHYHPYYEGLGHRRGTLPVTERVYEQILTLPLFPTMTDEDVQRVVSTVKEILARHGG